MKTIILDAYNVIHEFPELSGKIKNGLCEARKGLHNFMVDWKQYNKFKGKVYIVYDGQDGVFSPKEKKMWGVECIFTGSKEDADDRIIAMVRRASKTSDIVVVSGDGRVANGCKVYGVKVKSPAFLKQKRKMKKSETEVHSKGSLSGKDEHEINKYYKEVLGL